MKLRMPARLTEVGSAKCVNCRQPITVPSDIPDLCATCVLVTNGELHICRDCGREWTEAGDAHCAACHRHFSSDSAFDMHQAIDHGRCAWHQRNQGDNKHKVCVAESVCRDPAGLHKRDGSPRLIWTQTERGVTWSKPAMSAEAVAQLRSHT
jgi:hypothetical protein